MLYYGIINGYENLKVVNYDNDYIIPTLSDFFTDINNVEVCSPIYTLRRIQLKSIILSSKSCMLTWFSTRWCSTWLFLGDFDKNIELLKELLDRGLIRIKLETKVDEGKI